MESQFSLFSFLKHIFLFLADNAKLTKLKTLLLLRGFYFIFLSNMKLFQNLQIFRFSASKYFHDDKYTNLSLYS
jgi:hypothetical protein